MDIDRPMGTTGHLLVCAACVLQFSAPHAAAQSEEAASAEGRQLVEDFVTDVRTMSGRFEQSLVENDEITETSRGTFRIMRPGRFRWSYSEPYEQLLVADGSNVWSYDVDLEQVTVKPQAEALGSTPASLLGGSAEALDSFEVKGSFTDRGTTWVRLQPRAGDSSFETVELGFTDGLLTRMILADDLEQTTLVALFDVEVNEEIDPGQFRFSPPDDVDLVGQPVAPAASER
jgi:chaperone LolA